MKFLIGLALVFGMVGGAFAQARLSGEPKWAWDRSEVREFLNPSPKPVRKLGAKAPLRTTVPAAVTKSLQTAGEIESQAVESEENEEEEGNTNNLLKRWSERLDPNAYAWSSDLWNKSKMESRTPGGPATPWVPIGSYVVQQGSNNAHAGRVDSMAFGFDASENKVLPFFGTTGGGIWRRGSSGFVVPFSQTLPGSPSVGGMAMDPNNSQRIIVGTGVENRFGSSGIYRTTDGGVNWTRVTLPGGTQPGFCTRAVFDTNDATSNTVIVSTDIGIYRTTNFGTSWVRSFAGVTVDDLVKDFTAPNWWFATVRGQGIYLSADSGVTWLLRLNTSTLGLGRIRIAYAPSSPDHVYALAFNTAGGTDSIYHSKDFGQAWLAANRMTFAADPISSSQSFHASFISVDPNDANKIYFGSASSNSITNATTATGVVTPVAWNGGYFDYNDVIPTPDKGTGYILCDAGAFSMLYSVPGVIFDGANRFGLQCLQTIVNDNCLSDSRNNFNRLISGLQDNFVVRIDTTASPALTKLGGADGGRVGMNTDNGNWLYFSGGAYSSGPPFRQFVTKDGTSNSLDVTNPAMNLWAQAMTPDATPGYGNNVYSNAGNQVFRADMSVAVPAFTQFGVETAPPGGRTTRSIEVAYGYGTFESAFVTFNENSNIALVGGGSVGTWANRAITWPIGTNPRPLVDVDRWTEGRVYACSATNGGFGPAVRRSTDYGVTWTDITGNMGTILGVGRVFHVISHPYFTSTLYAATEFGVLVSYNNGTNWERFIDGMPTSVLVDQMRMGIDSQGFVWLRIGTFGRGFWQRKLTNAGSRTIRVKGTLADTAKSFQLPVAEFTPSIAGEFKRAFFFSGANGSLDTFLTVEAGVYRVWVKGPNHLAGEWLNIDARYADVVLTPQVFLNGDVDNDNVVSILDYSILSDAFDKSVGDVGFVSAADLDGDDTVSILDYSLLSDNFDKEGVPQ